MATTDATAHSERPPAGGIQRVSRRVMNLAHIVTQNARRFPRHPGLVWRDQEWDWSTIDRRVSALAAGLRDAGIGKGDRVLVHARNSDEMLWSMFACFRLAAVWVPTNFRLLPDEVVYLATQSGAKAMLCDVGFADHARAVAMSVPSVAFIWSVGRGTLGAGGGDHDRTFGAAVADVIDQHTGQSIANAAVDHDDPCWFFYTSGTTGRSKAAVLTHGQMGFVITNHLADLLPGITEADASLVVAPLSHGAGIHLLDVAARGAPSVLLPTERLDLDAAWHLIERHNVSNLFTVPTILKLMVEHGAVDIHDHSSLRFVIYAGAPMYREDQKRALAKLGPVIVQYFGLGEVTGNITVLPPHLHSIEDGPAARVGTCGVARTGMEIEIQDDTGAALAAGETGEICVIGPAVFAGYYDNPDANGKAFRRGWFRTGDLGHLDAEGYLYITGRASDMYISGGSNVYPLEIEEKILTHPAIAEVAVVGVPDPLWGEVGIAVCVARPDSPVDEAALLHYLGTKVPRYKLPRRVFFWEALPKSGYGKIPKRLVRDEIFTRGLLDPPPC